MHGAAAGLSWCLGPGACSVVATPLGVVLPAAPLHFWQEVGVAALVEPSQATFG